MHDNETVTGHALMCAQKVMSVLDDIDNATARAAIGVASVLLEHRITCEALSLVAGAVQGDSPLNPLPCASVPASSS